MSQFGLSFLFLSALGSLAEGMVRGGARNFKKPWVDVDLLYACLQKHHAQDLSFGIYEGVSKSWAVDFAGLIENRKLLLEVAKVCPSCNPHEKALKKAVVRYLMHNPKANSTGYKGEVWVGLRVERVCVMLSHLRQAARKKDFALAVLRLPAKEVALLKALLDIVAVEGSALENADEHEVLAICDAEDVEDEDALSLDEHGFPKLLETPGKQKGEKRRAESPSPFSEGGRGRCLLLGVWMQQPCKRLC